MSKYKACFFIHNNKEDVREITEALWFCSGDIAVYNTITGGAVEVQVSTDCIQEISKCLELLSKHDSLLADNRLIEVFRDEQRTMGRVQAVFIGTER